MTRPQIDTLLSLPTHAVNQLILDATFNYDNPVQSMLGIYKVITGKSKVDMTHLKSPSYSLQPKQSCNDWNPTVRIGTYGKSLETCDFELNGEQCPDEFDEGCARFIRDGSAAAMTGQKIAIIDDIQASMIMLLRESLGNDFYRILNFGDETFAAKVASGVYDLSALTPEQKARVVTQQGKCNGIWAEITERATLTNDEQKVRIFDTYDGTDNATDPANITDFLTDMHDNSHPLLQAWDDDMKVWMLQPVLFNALIKYYRSRNVESAMQLLMNGTVVKNATTFNGVAVIKSNDWNMFDFETGKTGKNARAILTAKQNITYLLNAHTLKGFGNDSFIVQQSPLVKDKGKTFMYGAWGLGSGIAQPQLITAAKNSVPLP